MDQPTVPVISGITIGAALTTIVCIFLGVVWFITHRQVAEPVVAKSAKKPAEMKTVLAAPTSPAVVSVKGTNQPIVVTGRITPTFATNQKFSPPKENKGAEVQKQKQQ